MLEVCTLQNISFLLLLLTTILRRWRWAMFWCRRWSASRWSTALAPSGTAAPSTWCAGQCRALGSSPSTRAPRYLRHPLPSFCWSSLSTCVPNPRRSGWDGWGEVLGRGGLCTLAGSCLPTEWFQWGYVCLCVCVGGGGGGCILINACSLGGMWVWGGAWEIQARKGGGGGGGGGGEKQTHFAVVAVESINYLLSVVFEWAIGGWLFFVQSRELTLVREWCFIRIIKNIYKLFFKLLF